MTYKKNELDILKGVAIIAVMVRHFAGFSTSEIVSSIAIGCNCFVNIFFIISSYLAFKSLDRTSSIKEWYLKRYKRIAPDFYFASLIFALLTMIGCYNVYAEYWRGNMPISFLNIFEHITLTISLSPSAKNGIIGVEWYVGVIALFMLVSPLIFKKTKTLRASVLLLITVTITIVVAKYYICKGYDPESMYRKFFEDCSPFNVMSTWLLVLCIYCGEKEGLFEKKNDVLSNTLIVLSVIFFVVYSFTSEMIKLSMIKPIIMDIICLPVVVSSMITSSGWRNKKLEYLGKHSYSIYLWHFIVIVLYVTFMGVPAFGAGLTVVFSLAAIVVAIPFSIFMEKPVKKIMELIIS